MRVILDAADHTPIKVNFAEFTSATNASDTGLSMPPKRIQINLKPADLATIWRGGCIIRARFLNRITEAYERDEKLPLLIADDFFAGIISECLEAWRRVVAGAAQNGIPTPAFSSSLAYYDGVRADRLPAALIQGLRDLFGAHTYRRVDKDGTFHTEWGGDRSETRVGGGFAEDKSAHTEEQKVDQPIS